MKTKFYAVAAGRVPGIYTTWAGAGGAEAQVKGFPAARFKSFPSKHEAEQWIMSIATMPTPAPRPATHTAKPATANDNDLAIHAQALAAGKVIIYTDGGCAGNPGRGSYGAVILTSQGRRELASGYAYTTNNRMEMMACIIALQSLQQPSEVAVFSDSAYLVNAITKHWAVQWKRNNWKRNQDGLLVDVKNPDLWQILLDLCALHRVTFVKVRGHAGNTENERCHELASAAMQGRNLQKDVGFG